MIVTCERCATQFQLDDTRVPENGVRVRCSRCKHAFEVHRPAPAPPSAGPEDEESDWEFSEDLPSDPGASRGPGGDAAASVVDDLLGGSEPGGVLGSDALAPSGLELGGDAPAPSGLELGGDAPASSGLELGGDAPASSGLELGEDAPASSGLELGGDAPAASDVEVPSPAAPAATKPPDPEEAPLHAEPRIGSSAAAPSGLDLATDEGPAATTPAPPSRGADLLDALASELESELAEDLDVRSVESDPEPEAESSTNELSPADWDLLAGSDAGPGTRAARVLEVDPTDLVDDRPRWQTALEGAGQIVGSIAVLLLFGLGLRGGLLPAPAVSAAPPVGILEEDRPDAALDEVSGRFVDHSAAGPVYVLSGRLQNTGSRPVVGGSLAIVVLDAEGRRLRPPVAVGVPLAARALREGELEDPRRISPPLRPGETRAVEAVLAPLPPRAQRLALVTVEAPPAVAPAPTPPPAANATAATNQPGELPVPPAAQPPDASGSPAAPAP